MNERSNANFPSTITAILKQRFHAGASQLWAPFELGGKQYRLVVAGPGNVIPGCCRAGEEWILEPTFSPNGHIVFCTPIRSVKAAGEHPIVAKTKRFVEAHARITVEIGRSALPLEGTVDTVEIDGAQLRITIDEVIRIERAEGGCDVFVGFPQLIECPWETAHFAPAPKGSLAGRCFVNGLGLRVTFWAK